MIQKENEAIEKSAKKPFFSISKNSGTTTPQFKVESQKILLETFTSNLKLAVIAMYMAMFLYAYMVYTYIPSDMLQNWILYIIPPAFFTFLIVFIFERKISSMFWREFFLITGVVMTLFVIGLFFFEVVRISKNIAIALATHSLMVGIIGAAAFSFSASKYAFLLSATALSGPSWYYLLFENTEETYHILALMQVVYLLVLLYFSRKDYRQRKDLILTRYSLAEEKSLVEKQSLQLQNTLDEVHGLKKKQDGDYFLTSLLLRPLGVNRTKTEELEISFLIRQKKQFKFEKWERDIGGDICISHTIKLQNKTFTVFLNADAMGKSIQGAGGAIVLGAVFQSIIERTKISRTYYEKPPERWLKDAFLELHAVFESFEGSMLISLVLGLVENTSGILYFINAEHPWTILYRDEKASFLDNEDSLFFRKLGTTGMDGSIHIGTFQLKKGDILILGSDGRDDILLLNDNGEKSINNNSDLILRLTEEAKGELQNLYNNIAATGELTDDISLLRLEYKKDLEAQAVANEKEYPVPNYVREVRELLIENKIEEARKIITKENPTEVKGYKTSKYLAQIYYKLKDYQRAAHFSEEYSNIYPNNTRFLFLTSYCYRKIGNLEKAVEYAERVRLRNPDDII
ncbi:MAG: SpoIIE family protein phosphatase, partial [Leptospiraceae bacterium]|nr:SpoIIE family protein phosphatase [Leptospiraceae bacterium]